MIHLSISCACLFPLVTLPMFTIIFSYWTVYRSVTNINLRSLSCREAKLPQSSNFGIDVHLQAPIFMNRPVSRKLTPYTLWSVLIIYQQYLLPYMWMHFQYSATPTEIFELSCEVAAERKKGDLQPRQKPQCMRVNEWRGRLRNPSAFIE